MINEHGLVKYTSFTKLKADLIYQEVAKIHSKYSEVDLKKKQHIA